MKDINEVFEPLDKRIDLLNIVDFRWFIAHAGWNDRVDMNFIERRIFQFKEHAVQRIDFSLKEIDKLLQKGTEIFPLRLFAPDQNDLPYEYINTVTPKKSAEELQAREFSRLKDELDFYISELNRIKSDLVAEQKAKLDQVGKIELSADYNITNLKKDFPIISSVALDKDQSAILFHYLKENNIVLPYDNMTLGKLVSLLTGHSANTLSKESFGNIFDIQEDTPHFLKKKGKNLTNLEIVRQILVTIVQQMDEKIASPSFKKVRTK